MQVPSDFKIRTNYTIIKVDDETLISIMAKFMDLPREEISSMGKLHKELENIVPRVLREYKWEYYEKLKIYKWHNIVPAVLRNELATLLTWTTVTPTFKANKIAMWSWSTTPLNTDTELQTETIRWDFSDRYAIDNIAYLDKFRSSWEVGGNSYQEVGIFVDGTWTVNTWYLLSRILINETMTSTETLSINASIEIV